MILSKDKFVFGDVRGTDGVVVVSFELSFGFDEMNNFELSIESSGNGSPGFILKVIGMMIPILINNVKKRQRYMIDLYYVDHKNDINWRLILSRHIYHVVTYTNKIFRSVVYLFLLLFFVQSLNTIRKEKISKKWI